MKELRWDWKLEQENLCGCWRQMAALFILSWLPSLNSETPSPSCFIPLTGLLHESVMHSSTLPCKQIYLKISYHHNSFKMQLFPELIPLPTHPPMESLSGSPNPMLARLCVFLLCFGRGLIKKGNLHSLKARFTIREGYRCLIDWFTFIFGLWYVYYFLVYIS